ncbi:tRNA-queuosine alpha-mannosyltransferase domain-containing protein [Microbulbifer hydrolyticus]|uniref:tRNA-queuosine alpha-mannosyltransferase n=1 Tax=Microbulbifer hydrolyticus TaxID=48074 RepID=A0AA89T3Y9_9GAMM|nr:DUF3524 domain-containing protein [Microbulbifer hydrolyticus]MBB5210007.1 glycosyltransferase involved in cell wall biosynthesis [Microbulbifer hydrolyticus]
MKVLLLSAYDADSHKRWRRGLVAAIPEWQWTTLGLPPRYFSWRVRGNSLSWGRGEALATLRQPWDLLVTTSMTDLASLRGLVPELGRVPTVVYFHENQFDYPRSEEAVQSVEPQLLNIYTALCGDLLLFNSEYNRSTLLEGAEGLLHKLPDQVPRGICREIADKSRILPVPLEATAFAGAGRAIDGSTQRPTFAWNHRWEYGFDGVPSEDTLIISWAARWEYDKGADKLLQILEGLKRKQVKFLLNMIGQSFRNSPSEFATIKRRFADHLLVVGYVESAELYRETLRHSHVVLSTAIHEFQGLSVMEAVALGCCPVVPDGLAYPEYYRKEHRYSGVSGAVDRLKKLAGYLAEGKALPRIDMNEYSWEELGVEYRKALTEIVNVS